MNEIDQNLEDDDGDLEAPLQHQETTPSMQQTHIDYQKHNEYNPFNESYEHYDAHQIVDQHVAAE